MSARKHIPQRSCVACRQVRPKSELLRVVRTPEGAIKADDTGKLAGRGAYVCRHEQCLEQAFKEKRLTRSLGTPVDGEVATEIRQRLGRCRSAE